MIVAVVDTVWIWSLGLCCAVVVYRERPCSISIEHHRVDETVMMLRPSDY